MQAQAMKHICIRTKGDAWLTSLDGAQGRTRHTRTFGDERHRKPAPKPRQVDVLTKLPEESLDGRMW